MASCVRTTPFHIHPFTVGDVRIQFVSILPIGNRRIVRACPTQADLLVAIDYRESSRLRRGRLRVDSVRHDHRGAGQQGGYRSAPPALQDRGQARQYEAGRLRKQMLSPSLHAEAERLRSTRVRNHRFGSETARSPRSSAFWSFVPMQFPEDHIPQIDPVTRTRYRLHVPPNFRNAVHLKFQMHFSKNQMQNRNNVILGCRRAFAAFRPSPGDLVLLSDAGLVLPPDFDLDTGAEPGAALPHALGEVFLNAASAASSWA